MSAKVNWTRTATNFFLLFGIAAMWIFILLWIFNSNAEPAYPSQCEEYQTYAECNAAISEGN